MKRLENKIFSSKRSDRGASLVEYALLLALVALIGVVSVGQLGQAIGDQQSGAFGYVATTLADAHGGGHCDPMDPFCTDTP